MKDDKFNFYEWTGVPDMDLDGDIDSSDDLLYDQFRKSSEKPRYEGEDIDDIPEDCEHDEDFDEKLDGDEDDYNADTDDDDEEDEDDDEDRRITDITMTLSFGDDDDDDDDDDELTEIEKRHRDAQKYLERLDEKEAQKKSNLEYIKRSKFIVESPSIAAKYCDYILGFDFMVEAVNDNFALPQEFLEYYDVENMIFSNFMEKLADYDPDLCIKVWTWLIIQFQPYAEYDEKHYEKIIYEALECFDDCSDEYADKVFKFLGDEYGFLVEIVRNMSRAFNYSFIYEAIMRDKKVMAKDIFRAMLENPRVKLSHKEEMAGHLIHECDYFLRGSVKGSRFCNDELMPMLRSLNSNILNKSIARWQKDIDEYLSERNSDDDDDWDEDDDDDDDDD